MALADYSGSGLDFGSLAGNSGVFSSAVMDSQGGYESGSGFWTFANKGIDALASFGGGWLNLQQQSNQPQYQGQPEQTREQGVLFDNNGTRGQSSGGGMLWLLLGGGLVLLTLHLQKG